MSKLTCALERWARFAVPPLELETPLCWYPRIAQWTDNAARVRWETLTGTPLEMSWKWCTRKPQAGTPDHVQLKNKIGAIWTAEQEAAEKQARQAGMKFEWSGPEASLRTSSHGLCREGEGVLRRYALNGHPGLLCVVFLNDSTTPGGREAFCAFTLSAEGTEEAFLKLATRILNSLKIRTAAQPVLLAYPGWTAELPVGLELDALRIGGGQAFGNLVSKNLRVNFARLSFADLHLANSARQANQRDKKKQRTEDPRGLLRDGLEAAGATLARLLFDRSESPGFLHRVPGAGEAPQAPTGGQVREVPCGAHHGLLYQENHRFYMRWGDGVLRRLGRGWAGGATAVAWKCDQSGALWACAVRCGAQDATLELTKHATGFMCHGANELLVDWSGFLEAELHSAPIEKISNNQNPKSTNPVAQRGEQLRYKIRATKNIRLEVSSKDGTGRLYYPLPAPTGLVAALTGANQPGREHYGTLDLDPVGRKIWEELTECISVGELLVRLSTHFRVHPVELFELLLTFLRMLGEKRLVEAS